MSRVGAQVRTGAESQVQTWSVPFVSKAAYVRPQYGETRPSDWPALPTATGEKVELLFPVRNNGANYIALSCAGNYNVDWGDGTSANFAASAQAERNIAWADAPSATVTSEGFRICRVVITPQAGANLTIVNFNRMHTSLSTTQGSNQILEMAVSGSNITSFIIGADGIPAGNPGNFQSRMYSLRYFRWHGQCAVTSLNLMFYNCYSLQEITFDNCSAAVSALRFAANASNLRFVSMPFCNSLSTSVNMFNNCSSLEKIDIGNLSALQNANSMFFTCISLQDVAIIGTTSLLDSSSMFAYCYNLQNAYVPNLAAVTNANSMFTNCDSLTSVSLHLPAATDVGSILEYSGALSNLEFTGTSVATSFAGAFQGTNIRQITLDTRAATSLASAFNGCSELKSVTFNSLSAVTTLFSTFSNCAALEEVTLTGLTTTCVNLWSTFNNCYALYKVDLVNTSGVTIFRSAFNGCYSLRTISNLDTRASTGSYSSTFSNVTSLPELTVNASGITSAIDVPSFASMYGLQKLTLTNMRWTHSLADNRLDATRLNDHYTNLLTLPTAKNISAGSVVGSTVTITTSTAHTFWSGMTCVIASVNPSTYNGTFTITVTASNQFTYVKAGVGAYVSGGTATPSATVTVTGNPGTATDNTTIATAKGWTVTG